MKNKMLLFLMIIAMNLNCFAAPSDDLSKILNKIKSMSASFVQVTYDNRDRPVQVSRGKLAWMRPGKFRWEVATPVPQLIIANGSKLWIVDPELQQVTVRKVNPEFGDTPTMLLSENFTQLAKQFVVTVKNKDNMPTYSLKPKKRDSTFQMIQVQFKNNHLQTMRLEDQLGHITKINFNQLIENLPLSASLFQYVPKRGMDVITE